MDVNRKAKGKKTKRKVNDMSIKLKIDFRCAKCDNELGCSSNSDGTIVYVPLCPVCINTIRNEKKNDEVKKEFVYVWEQSWVESERGWGSRLDGFSYHLRKEDIGKYVEAYWASMPAETPDEYSRPVGNPEKVLVLKSFADTIKGNGLRCYSGKSVKKEE